MLTSLILFRYSICSLYSILKYRKLNERPLMRRKLPKYAKKWQKSQILQLYYTAQFVQHVIVRVEYDTPYYTNMTHDKSLSQALHVKIRCSQRGDHTPNVVASSHNN
jgi:hypothetical protein